jgi:mannosyltransferase
MAIAAVLGLITIGDKSIWLDEAFSIAAARLPTLDLLSFLWRFELHASPYYLLLHPWLVLGTGEAATRSLAVVFGVAAVAATFAVGRRYNVAFSAALLLSVAPLFVTYEQEVRVYTLAAAWSAISTLAYLRLTERPTRLRAVVYFVCGALAIYVHPLVALVIAAHVVAAIVFRSDRVSNRWLIAIYAAIVISWIPMFRFMLLHRDKINWIPPLTPGLFADYLVVLGGGLLLALVAAVLIALGLRRDVVTLWLLVPVAGAVLISVLVQPVIQARYLLIILPPAAIIIARNKPILVGAFAVLCLVGVANWYANGVKDDWRTMAAWVSAESRPGDGIIFAPHYERLPFEYYAKVDEPLYPSTPWDGRYLPAMGLDIAINPAAANPRIWVIEEHGNQLPPDVAAVVDRYAAIETRSFGPDGPVVRLMERSP